MTEKYENEHETEGERQGDGATGDTPKLRLGSPPKGRRLRKKARRPSPKLTAEQRLLILDTWKRSGLPAKDFAPLVGVSKHTLYGWKKKFEEHGPSGLMSQPRGPRPGSKLPELTKRAILMVKEANPEYGCQRISDMLARGPAIGASPKAVAKVLKEAGYELEEVPTRQHRDRPRRFERAKPNQLWQTDIFTFVLKRQNRRVYLVGFLDDHSRFLVGYGLHASQTTALVLEAFRAALSNFGAPEEVLTDNGTQYVTWRGKSQFRKELDKRGIAHVVARPRHPRTLGKIERFWGTLWRECVEAAVFRDLEDARRRIGHYIDHYNFHRTHQGIGGLVPADRYFEASEEVRRAMQERIADNALSLARHGTPKQPLYLTGTSNGRPFTVHSEGDRVFLKREGEPRKEVDLTAPEPSPVPEPAASSTPAADDPTTAPEPGPGESPLDEALENLRRSFPDMSEDRDDEGEVSS